MDINEVIKDIKDKLSIDNIVNVLKEVKIIDEKTITEHDVRDTLNKTKEYVEISKKSVEENKDLQEFFVCGKTLVHDCGTKFDEVTKDIDFQDIAKKSGEKVQAFATFSEEKIGLISEKVENNEILSEVRALASKSKESLKTHSPDEVVSFLQATVSKTNHKFNEWADLSLKKLKSLLNTEEDMTTNDLEESTIDSASPDCD